MKFLGVSGATEKAAAYRAASEVLAAAPPAPAAVAGGDGEALARRFHETYERLAPSFGYETRKETRKFDPTTPNGRLMIAVCTALAEQPAAGEGLRAVLLGDAIEAVWSDAPKARVANELDGKAFRLPAAQRPGAGDALVDTALRNLPQYISKSSPVGPDKHSALECVEVLRRAVRPVGEA